MFDQPLDADGVFFGGSVGSFFFSAADCRGSPSLVVVVVVVVVVIPVATGATDGVIVRGDNASTPADRVIVDGAVEDDVEDGECAAVRSAVESARELTRAPPMPRAN